jgi:predicted dehydrogenase
MKKIGVGLVGSGFMGRSHSHAFRAAAGVFALPAAPVLELLADIDEAVAAKAAKGLGFARSTGDWRALVADPAVDLVDITTPNTLHKPIALAAIAAGKPVYCEKPLAPNAAEAKEMVDAAEAAGILTLVGFNYLKPDGASRPQLIENGEIGEIVASAASTPRPRPTRTRRSPGGLMRAAGMAWWPISAATSSPSPVFWWATSRRPAGRSRR